MIISILVIVSMQKSAVPRSFWPLGTALQIESGLLTKSMLISEGHVDDTLVSKGAHRRDDGALLTTTLASSRHEDTGKLSVVCTSSPLLASAVPEGLPLRGEVTVAGGDTKEEGIELLELRGVGEDLDVGGLGRGVHLGEDLIGEGLLDLEEGGRAAGLLDALLLGFGLAGVLAERSQIDVETGT